MSPQENSKLKNLFKLSHKVSVFCPTQDELGRLVDGAADIVDRTSVLLSELCGGATSSLAVGYWIGESGLLVRENVTLVFAYCVDLTADLIDKVVVHCEQIKSELRQESVAVEIDGELYFV